MPGLSRLFVRQMGFLAHEGNIHGCGRQIDDPFSWFLIFLINSLFIGPYYTDTCFASYREPVVCLVELCLTAIPSKASKHRGVILWNKGRTLSLNKRICHGVRWNSVHSFSVTSQMLENHIEGCNCRCIVFYSWVLSYRKLSKYKRCRSCEGGQRIEVFESRANKANKVDESQSPN